MISYLDPVVLTRDLPERGLRRGDVGAVVHEHAPGTYEVEFVTGGGTTVALVTLGHDAVRSLTGSDVLHVRERERV
jgi:hypothetical protein